MNPSKELVCKENGKIFRLYTNGIKFDKIKLDDGQNSECKKCDYLIVKSTNDIQIFIELKGNKIAKAYQQILASYNDINRAKNLQVKYYAAIVSSRYPKEDTTIQTLKREAKKIFAEIFIKNKKMQTQYNPTNNSIEKTN